MLRGLPFSNVLGRWSGHSCSSSSDSCAFGGSCSWISSGSSGPTSFSCEPVWCMCAHEWSARCPSGCLYEKVPKDHDMMHRRFNWSCSLQGSQHHLRVGNRIKHLLHSLLQIFFKCNQQPISCFKDTPNPFFILFNLYITIINYLFISRPIKICMQFCSSINPTKITGDYQSSIKSTINFS